MCVCVSVDVSVCVCMRVRGMMEVKDVRVESAMGKRVGKFEKYPEQELDWTPQD